VQVNRFVAARDHLLDIDRAQGSVDGVLRQVLASLHHACDFDAGAVLLTDAHTLLPFGGVVEGLSSEGCVPFWDNELLDPDFNKFAALAGSSDPVATLYEATDGDLDRSPRFRQQLAPAGAGDELRIALRTGDTCWAVAFMFRPAELGPFPTTETQTVRDLLPVMAKVVRGAVIRRDTDQLGSAPAVLVVAADGSLESATGDGARLLEEFAIQGVEPIIATPVLAAARRAQKGKSVNPVTLRARGSSGQWFRLHASPLCDDGRVAVVIEVARASDLVPILLESYGLTDREAHIVPLIARGLSTKQIAAELCISRHTVSDYMKTIFEKCAVTSRGELVAKIFTETILDSHKAQTGYV
jgi:DNA-binding CsgD family transcriptional regulator